MAYSGFHYDWGLLLAVVALQFVVLVQGVGFEVFFEAVVESHMLRCIHFPFYFFESVTEIKTKLKLSSMFALTKFFELRVERQNARLATELDYIFVPA